MSLFPALPSAFESLHALQGLTPVEVTLEGKWEPPDQYQHQFWIGKASADVPLVAIIFALTRSGVYWMKSSQFLPSFPVELFHQPSTDHKYFQHSLRLHDARLWHGDYMSDQFKNGVPQIPSHSVIQAGQLFHFATVASPVPTKYYMLFFAKSDAKIARKRIWGLKKRFQPALIPPLLDVLVRGRKGILWLERFP